MIFSIAFSLKILNVQFYMPDMINVDKIVFDDQNVEKRSIVVLFGTNLFEVFNCVFVPIF